MPRIVWLVTLLAACADMGPRDRSLAMRIEILPPPREAPRPARPARPPVPPSVIGLASDPLAPLYADGAPCVIRCADQTTLEQGFKTHADVLRTILPELGLPGGAPAELLHRRFGLPATARIDRRRPFAFVRTDAGWTALLPVDVPLPESDRYRMLDDHYAVAGRADAVRAYEPGVRTGFFLPGEISVIARGETSARVGSALQEAAGIAGIELPAIPGLGAKARVRRVDVAVRFLEGRARLDVRLAPDRGARGGLSDHLLAARSRDGSALRWLPHGATVEIAGASDVLTWLDLARSLGAFDAPLPLVREAVATLGDDFALQLHLHDGRPGVALLVAELAAPDREAARVFLRDGAIASRIRSLAGPGGHFEYAPAAFERNDVQVATITGYFGADTLAALRARGGFAGTLAESLRGPVVVYIALTSKRLCVVAGERSRADMEALLDRIAGGIPRRTLGECAAGALLNDRLGAARIDVCALLRGTRAAARHWHPDGDRLRGVPFEDEIPLDLVASAEGGALRVALQVPDLRLAALVARIRDVLR